MTVSGFEYYTQAIHILCPTALVLLRPKHLLSPRTCFHSPQMSRRVIVFGQFLKPPFITYIFRVVLGRRCFALFDGSGSNRNILSFRQFRQRLVGLFLQIGFPARNEDRLALGGKSVLGAVQCDGGFGVLVRTADRAEKLPGN